MKKINLEALPNKFAICRLDKNDIIPTWALQSKFFSITKTYDELSIVCIEEYIPKDIKAEKGWRALKVQGPLDFGLTGILSALLSPLAENKIAVFAVSTYDTDYILIKEHAFDRACALLSVTK